MIFARRRRRILIALIAVAFLAWVFSGRKADPRIVGRWVKRSNNWLLLFFPPVMEFHANGFAVGSHPAGDPLGSGGLQTHFRWRVEKNQLIIRRIGPGPFNGVKDLFLEAYEKCTGKSPGFSELSFSISDDLQSIENRQDFVNDEQQAEIVIMTYHRESPESHLPGLE